MEIENEVERDGEVNPLETLAVFLADPTNIAELIEDRILNDIGEKCLERINADRLTMDDWSELVKWGRKVNKQTTQARMMSDKSGAPFDNAANFKSPIMQEAALKWSDRATTEILRHKDLVKPESIGIENEVTKAKGERTAKHMNYQLNVNGNWRTKHDKMLYEIPSVGVVFKKTFYNSISGQNESDLIHFPDFIVDNNASSIEEAQGFAHEYERTQNQIEENERSGLWTERDTKIDETQDGDNVFIEYHGYYDIDDDGYEEPYIITLHKGTGDVVRITPRYEADDIFVRNEEGSLITYEEMVQAIEESQQEVELEGIEVVRINPINYITKYGFIPTDDGSFLDWGYFHVLGHLTNVINSTTNMMLDAGKLANTPSGLLSKAFRTAKKKLQLIPGVFQTTDMSSKDLHEGVFQFPFKGADASLLELNRDINQQARQLSSSIDLATVLGTNAPASTTLALLQEQMVSSSAIISRIHRSTSDEFSIIFKLNSKFTDPEEYIKITGEEADYQADYSEQDINIIPTSNPELSSKMERIQLAEVALAQVPMLQQLGGNPVPLVEGFFDSIGYKGDIKELFAQTEGQARADQQIKQKEQELQQQQLDQTERLLAVQEAEQQASADLKAQEQSRKDVETANKMDETERSNKADEAIKLLELELESSQDLNAQFTDNLVVFDAAVGDFVKAN